MEGILLLLEHTLNITGRPCFAQNSFASSLVVTGPSVPGTIGTPEIYKTDV